MPEPVDASKVLSPAEEIGLIRAKEFLRIGSAYAFEQATRPSTLGMVLSSNPLALLAWYFFLLKF
jgi:microsomal epoxide hydrolase